MPYVKWEQRDELDMGAVPNDVGELNYTLTTQVLRFLGPVTISYKGINEAIGALECAKLELYRRLAAPYEDEKIKQNGDVYGPPVRR